jgi:photosystem II stability/assembly factor-like uncharacterized protein
MMEIIFAALLLAAAGSDTSAAAAPAREAWQQLPMPAEIPADNVRDLLIDPAGNLYVSFDKQGLWRSSDHGQTWKSIQYNIPALTAGGFFGITKEGQILFAPNDHAHQAIYRLPAGGAEWVAAEYDPAPLGSSGYPGRFVLTKSGDVICVASANGGNRVLHSADGGRTFTYTKSVLGGAALFDVKVSPFNADEIAVGTETGPAWHSTDGGLTWTDIGKPGGNLRLAYNRLGQLFGSATHDSAGKGWLLARWTGGTDWARSDTGLPPYEDTRSSALSIASGRMFLGSTGVYVSTDDGATWQSTGEAFSPNPGADKPRIASLAVDDSYGYLFAGVRTGSSGLPCTGVWRSRLVEAPATDRAAKSSH